MTESERPLFPVSPGGLFEKCTCENCFQNGSFLRCNSCIDKYSNLFLGNCFKCNDRFHKVHDDGKVFDKCIFCRNRINKKTFEKESASYVIKKILLQAKSSENDNYVEEIVDWLFEENVFDVTEFIDKVGNDEHLIFQKAYDVYWWIIFGTENKMQMVKKYDSLLKKYKNKQKITIDNRKP